MTTVNTIHLLISAGILLAGVIDDIRSRKIHNKLVLICLAVAVISMMLLYGPSVLLPGLMASFVAMALTLPFVLSKALGAGDMKLLMAFAFTSHWSEIFWIVVYSFVWGALLGLFRALLDKKALTLLKNTAFLLTKNKPTEEQMTKIPFSVALFLAGSPSGL